MKRNFVLLACCALMPLAAGCSQPVVRGQNGMRPYSQSPQMAGMGRMENMMTDGTMQMAGPPPGPVFYDGPATGNCPTCPTRPADIWRPTHHHTSSYNAPKDLKYPQANQPPAVYQYPYYTVKGPTDFFLK